MKTIYSIITILMSWLVCSFQTQAQTTTQNYIVTKTMTDASGTVSRDVIQYYDGLGRPVETVRRKFTPAGYDLVSRQDYDHLSRESKTWLPSPVAKTDGSYNGSSNAVTKYGDNNPYSETIYEASPLNRIDRQYGPGQNWRGANDRKVRTEYTTNASSPAERLCGYYYVSGNNLVRNGNYAPGTLYVTKATDENNSVSYEFKDKQGRTVLQRQMNSGVRYDTYYVYDPYGNLCFVLPPLCADATASNATYTESTQSVKDYAYLYRYDTRNRCTSKKLPGADWIYLVYDKADRLVLTQDGVQRGTGWTYYKYDIFGRLVMTGVMAGSNSAFETLKSSCTNGLVVESYAQGGGTGTIRYYTNTSPIAVTENDILVINYYDGHGFLTQFNDEGTPDLTALTYFARSGYGTRYTPAQGMLTGSYVKLTDVSAKGICAYYYNDRGLLLQSAAINPRPASLIVGGYDRTTFNYNFDNSVDKKQVEQTGISSQPAVTELYKYTYDAMGRLKSTTHTLNGGTAVTTSELTYNEFGQLSARKIAGGITQTSYTYNVRGWLKTLTGSKFSETLVYESGLPTGATARFNGDIAALNWTDPVSTTVRNYSFTYDDLSRMLTSTYAGSGSDNYRENCSYDKHGNLLTLSRYGRLDGGSFGLIDNLTFSTYQGNQVKRITDSQSNQSSADLMEFKYLSSTDPYAYDLNGRLTKDLNKKIPSIQYNYLHLPQKVEYQDGSRLEAFYDALGVRQKTRHYTGGGSTVERVYPGNKVYEGGVLKMILHDDGYIAKEAGVFNYYYYLKDHLGSNRVVLNATGGVEQVTNYYPFGLSFAERTARTDQYRQPYKYTGKELDRQFGFDTYDYGARMYNPSIGRFMTMDPLAEKYYSISPYVYCGNNPVNRIDPTGMIWDDVKEAERLKRQIENRISDLNKDIAKNQAKLDKGGLSDKQFAKLESKITESQDRISNLNTSKADIDVLGADQNNTYALSQTDGGIHQIKQGSNGKVYIETSSDALSIHEITHVRQSLDAGGLKFSSNGYLLNPGRISEESFSNVEIEAYRMQYSYDLSFPGRTNSLQGIDVHSVGDIWNPDTKKYVYPIIKAYSNKLKK